MNTNWICSIVQTFNLIIALSSDFRSRQSSRALKHTLMCNSVQSWHFQFIPFQLFIIDAKIEVMTSKNIHYEFLSLTSSLLEWGFILIIQGSLCLFRKLLIQTYYSCALKSKIKVEQNNRFSVVQIERKLSSTMESHHETWRFFQQMKFFLNNREKHKKICTIHSRSCIAIIPPSAQT